MQELAGSLRDDRYRQTLVAVVVLGGALRFATLDAQSYWLDEAATVDLVRAGLGDMLDRIPSEESTPPLYYLFAWVWSQVFGTGEVGLRALSALLGTATIPVAHAVGSWIGGRRAGLAAAVLCAANPFLVWYSQEARAYALLVLLTGLALLLLLRGRRAGWAVASAAALATHWFAVFPVAAMAVWALRRDGARRVVAPLAVVAAAGAALLPLAIGQARNDRADFIDESSLVRRVAQVPKQFLSGYDAPAEAVLALVAVAAAVVGLAGLRLLGPDPRRRALAVGALALAAALVPVGLAVAGPDYVLARNLVPALVLALPVLGAGLAALPRAGPAALAALAAVGVTVSVAAAAERAYQRDDWRGAAAALGRAERDRAILVTPASGALPLSLYLPGSRPAPPAGVRIDRLALVSMASLAAGGREEPARPAADWRIGPGYHQESRRDAETFTAITIRTGIRFHVAGSVGASPLDGRRALTLFQPAQDRPR